MQMCGWCLYAARLMTKPNKVGCSHVLYYVRRSTSYVKATSYELRGLRLLSRWLLKLLAPSSQQWLFYESCRVVETNLPLNKPTFIHSTATTKLFDFSSLLLKPTMRFCLLFLVICFLFLVSCSLFLVSFLTAKRVGSLSLFRFPLSVV